MDDKTLAFFTERFDKLEAKVDTYRIESKEDCSGLSEKMDMHIRSHVKMLWVCVCGVVGGFFTFITKG